jgi:hypothetical protein
MTVSLVRIITDPPGVRTFKVADGSISIQVVEAIVRVGEREERQVVVNSHPIALDSASRENVAREITTQIGSRTVSFLQENGPGYARVVTTDDQCLSAISVAAAVACYMICWGWDESSSIVVNVDRRSVTMEVGPLAGDGWSQLLGSEAPAEPH